MRNSRSLSIDYLRRRGLLGVAAAYKEETFILKGALMVTCRHGGLGLDAWKEALRLTLKELQTATRRRRMMPIFR